MVGKIFTFDNHHKDFHQNSSLQPHISAVGKWTILAWMSFQNALHTIFMRYSRSRPVEQMFLPSAAVFWMEVIKLTICTILVSFEKRGFCRAVSSIRQTIVDHPVDTLKVCIPSFVYTISNNLFYVAASHLDAATFMITSQLKLLTTAIFSVLILRKRLLRFQWTALFILFIGVSLVQWNSGTSTKNTASNKFKNATLPLAKPLREIAEAEIRSEHPFLGFCAAFTASLLAGFAGVYFEKILKSRAHNSPADISVWMRNVQLAFSSVPIALISAYAEDGEILHKHGLLYGFDSMVWLTVSWCGIGGLSVAVCIKYTDNIRKNFATSVAIVLSTILSIFVFHFRPTVYFVIGASMVVGAIFLYSYNYASDDQSTPSKFSSKNSRIFDLNIDLQEDLNFANGNRILLRNEILEVDHEKPFVRVM